MKPGLAETHLLKLLEVYSKKLDNNIIFTLMDNGVTFHTLYYESPILP